MAEVRDGEVEKLGVLFERHHQPLFNFFVRQTGHREFSDDLVQEVFFRMLKYRHTFQPQNQFRSWMFQVARNVHFDALRKRQREERMIARESEQPVESDSHTPDRQAGPGWAEPARCDVRDGQTRLESNCVPLRGASVHHRS